MATNGNGRRDNLDAAQDAIAAHDTGEPIYDSLAIQIAQARALIDIARTLRSLEGYLCNPHH